MCTHNYLSMCTYQKYILGNFSKFKLRLKHVFIVEINLLIITIGYKKIFCLFFNKALRSLINLLAGILINTICARY